MNNKTLASVVKEARDKLGISQRELSRMTGIDNNTLAKIEKGERKKPNVLSLQKLSVVLKLDIAKLMKLADYSDDAIQAIANNNYNSFAIHNENMPVIMLADIINDSKEQILIRKILKELLDECDIKNMNIAKNLKENEIKKVMKHIEKTRKKIDEEIINYSELVENLSKLLNEK